LCIYKWSWVKKYCQKPNQSQKHVWVFLGRKEPYQGHIKGVVLGVKTPYSMKTFFNLIWFIEKPGGDPKHPLEKFLSTPLNPRIKKLFQFVRFLSKTIKLHLHHPQKLLSLLEYPAYHRDTHSTSTLHTKICSQTTTKFIKWSEIFYLVYSLTSSIFFLNI